MADVALNISLKPTLDVPHLNAQLELLKKSFGPLAGAGIKPLDSGKWNAALASATGETQKLDKEVQKVGASAAGVTTNAPNRALNFAASVAATQQLSAALSTLSKPLVDLDVQVKNIGTLGTAGFEEFRDLALDLSKTVPDSAATIAAGAYNAISAGISGTNKQIISFVETAAKVAVAGVSDTNSAVNGLTSVLNAYKLNVSDAGSVADTFFAGIKLGKTSFNELNAGLANVVPAASAAKISFAEVTAVIAQMTALGVPTAQATTQIRAAIIELQKPGAQLASVMAGVTVTLDGVEQKLTASNIGKVLEKQGLTKTLAQVEETAKKMGLSLVQVFSSSEAGSAALLTTGDNAKRMAATLAQVNLEIAGGVATKAYEVAATSIGASTNVILNNVNAFVSKGLSALGDGVLTVANASAALAPTLVTFGQIGNLLPEGAVENVKAFAGAIGGTLKNAITGQISVTGLATRAQAFLNATMSANPVGAVIAGVVALTAAVLVLRNVFAETAQDRLEDAQANTAVLEDTKAAELQALEVSKAKIAQSVAFGEAVRAQRDLEKENLETQGKTAEQIKASADVATAGNAQITASLVDLAVSFPGVVDASKSYEDNIKSLEESTRKAGDEMIATAGRVHDLDVALAESKNIELHLNTEVAAQDLEDALTGAFNSGAINIVGKGADALFGTSAARDQAEELVAGYKNEVFGAKTQAELAAAQTKMISEISLNAEALGIDKKDQQAVIKGIRDFAAKRQTEIEQVKANDAQLTTDTAAGIASAYDTAIKSGQNADEVVKKLSASFTISSEKVKDIAFDAELKKATAAGELTDAKIQEIAKTFGKSAEDAKKLLAEQEKQTAEAGKTAEGVKRIGEAFDEAKKTAGDALSAGLSDLAEANRRLKDARTKEEKEAARSELNRIRQQGLTAKRSVDAITSAEEAAKRQLGLVKGQALKDLKDVLDQIHKLEAESESIRTNLAIAGLSDRTDAQRQELALRQSLEAKALQDEIEAVRANKELTLRAKEALEKALQDKLLAIQERQSAERRDLDLKLAGERAKSLYDKEVAEAQRLSEVLLSELQFRQDILSKQEAKTGADNLDIVREANGLKLKEIKEQHRKEIDEIVAKNAAVIEAENKYQAALIGGDTSKTIEAQQALNVARANAIVNDTSVLLAQKKQQQALSEEATRAAKAELEAKLNLIEDNDERSRQISLEAAKQRYADALVAAKGNQALELEAFRQLQADKLTVQTDFLKSTSAAFAAATNIATDLSNAFRDLHKLNSADAAAADEREHQRRMANAEDEAQSLEKRLKAGVILYEEYQNSINALEADTRAAESEARQKREEKEAKIREAKIQAVTAALASEAQKQTDIFIESAKKGEANYDALAAGVISNFAAMTVAGASFADAALASLIDLVSKSILAYIPEIMAAAAGLLGPIAGPIAAGALIAGIQLALGSARAQIGAETGVVGITASYNKPRGRTDTIPVWLAAGESVFDATKTRKHKALFEHVQAGNDPREFYRAELRKDDASMQGALERLIQSVDGVKLATERQRDRPVSVKAVTGKVSGSELQLLINVDQRKRKARR